MSAQRKDRLLREALGEQEHGEVPGAEGVLLAGAVCAVLLFVVLFVG